MPRDFLGLGDGRDCLKRNFKSIIHKALLTFAGVCSIFSLMPALTGIRHEGVLLGLVMSLLLWIWWIILERSPSLKLKRLITCMGVFCLLCLAVLLVPMLLSAYGAPPPQNPGIILVTGAQIRDGQPSLMLKNRLDSAYDVWLTHPESHIVVSGGFGVGMTQSEAEVMKAYLVGRGVPDELIITEDASTTTEENLLFSAEVVKDNGLSLSDGLTIATDGFHQNRCRMWAEVAGFSPIYAAPCATPPGLAPTYWLRDMMGIPHFWILEERKIDDR